MYEKIPQSINDEQKNELTSGVEEISDAEFVQEIEKGSNEISNYIKTVEDFRGSEQGAEIAKNSSSIEQIVNLLHHCSEEKTFNATVKNYQELNFKYDEDQLKKSISEIINSNIEKGMREFKKLFPEMNLNEFDKDVILKKISEYLEFREIDLKFNSDEIPEFALHNYPVKLESRRDEKLGIIMVDINKSKIETLDKTYELILKKFFAKLPKNSVLVYPAIGGDKIFCNIAEKYGHKVVGIDPHAEIPKESLFKENFESYKEIEKKMRKEGLLKEGDSAHLIFKGFDTLNEVEQKTVEKIIEEFSGDQIVLFGCGQAGSWFGQGVPKTEGRGRENLEVNPKFTDITQEYFNQDSIKKMEEITELSSKLEWTSGFFPATDIKIYSKN